MAKTSLWGASWLEQWLVLGRSWTPGDSDLKLYDISAYFSYFTRMGLFRHGVYRYTSKVSKSAVYTRQTFTNKRTAKVNFDVHYPELVQSGSRGPN